MARGKFKARHSWRGRTYEVGDVVEASPTQVAAWVSAGVVERIANPASTEPQRQPDAEQAIAPPPPENAAVTPRPRGRPRKRGSNGES